MRGLEGALGGHWVEGAGATALVQPCEAPPSGNNQVSSPSAGIQLGPTFSGRPPDPLAHRDQRGPCPRRHVPPSVRVPVVPRSTLGKQLLCPSAQDTGIPLGGSAGPAGPATSWAEAHALMTSQASPAPASRPQPPRARGACSRQDWGRAPRWHGSWTGQLG